MSISEKIKAIKNRIELNKAQYDLDKKTAKIPALSSGNVSKYEFLTGKDVLPEKDLQQKAVAIKRFEYSLLGKELKNETSVSKKTIKNLIMLLNLIKRKKTKQKTKEVALG